MDPWKSIIHPSKHPLWVSTIDPQTHSESEIDQWRDTSSGAPWPMTYHPLSLLALLRWWDQILHPRYTSCITSFSNLMASSFPWSSAGVEIISSLDASLFIYIKGFSSFDSIMTISVSSSFLWPSFFNNAWNRFGGFQYHLVLGRWSRRWPLHLHHGINLGLWFS